MDKKYINVWKDGLTYSLSRKCMFSYISWLFLSLPLPLEALYCWVTSACSLWCLELCPHHDSQEELLSLGCKRRQPYMLFVELSLSPKHEWHCHDCLLSREREGWLSVGHLILPFNHQHLYLLTHCVKHVIYSVSFNPYNNSMKVRSFIVFFHRWGNWGPGMASNLHEVTLWRGGAGSWIKSVWLGSLCPSSLWYASALCRLG